MKKNDLLEKFYRKRKSLVLRSFIFFLAVLSLILVSLKFQNEESFIAKIKIEGIIQDKEDIVEQIDGLISDDNVRGLITVIQQLPHVFQSLLLHSAILEYKLRSCYASLQRVAESSCHVLPSPKP